MGSEDRLYSNMEVGNQVVIRRVFKEKDYKQFSKLSGDLSPLHHDSTYASQTEFGECLVPVYLYSSPVSAVAGMFLPGHRSLILKTTISAIQPLKYGEEIIYSSKIVSKSDYGNLLTIRTIGFTKQGVVLDVETLVRVRDLPKTLSKELAAKEQALRSEESGFLLITGATSRIGQAIAINSAMKGKNLVLYYHSNEKSVADIKAKARQYGVEVYSRKLRPPYHNFFASLSKEPWYSRVDAVAHVYSSPMKSDLTSLMGSNYLVLKYLMAEIKPCFLTRQSGRLLNIGSSILFRHSEGHSDYAAAKAASTTFTSSLNQQYGGFGIECCTLAPDIVDTDFSENMSEVGVTKLLAEEVAEKAVALLLEESAWKTDCVWMTSEKCYLGDYKIASRLEKPFSENKLILASDSSRHRSDLDTNPIDKDASAVTDKIIQVVSRVLGIDAGVINSESGVTRTVGWNSLKHLEILMEIEREFGIQFKSDTLTRIETAGDIVDSICSSVGSTD